MADDKPKPLGGIVADLFCRVNDLFLVYQSVLENTERDRTVSLQMRFCFICKKQPFYSMHIIISFCFQGRHFTTGHRILGSMTPALDAKYAQMTYGEHYRKVSHVQFAFLN